MDGAGAVRKDKSGEIKAKDAALAALERIEAGEKRYHCYITVDAEERSGGQRKYSGGSMRGSCPALWPACLWR